MSGASAVWLLYRVMTSRLCAALEEVRNQVEEMHQRTILLLLQSLLMTILLCIWYLILYLLVFHADNIFKAFSSLTYQPPDAGMLPLQVIHFRLAGWVLLLLLAGGVGVSFPRVQRERERDRERERIEKEREREERGEREILATMRARQESSLRPFLLWWLWIIGPSL